MTIQERLKNLSKSEYVLLSLILIAGCLIRFAAILAYGHTPESDELAYRAMGLNLAQGKVVLDQMGNHAMYNVGYPLFVLAPIFVFFGENLFSVRFANLLLGLVGIYLCFKVAEELELGKKARLLAAGLWAIYLPSSVYAVYLAKENLMIPMMLGVMWCLLRLLKSPQYRTSLCCGLLFGLLALTGNAALSFAGCAAYVLVVIQASILKRVALGALMLGAAVLIAFPWMLRNAEVIGAPVLNTNGGFNLYLGNNPSANGYFMSIADTPRGPTWEKLRLEGEVSASNELKKDAIEWITANPLNFLYLSVKKGGYFWMPPLEIQKQNSSTTETGIRAIWLIQYIILFAGAFLSLFFFKKSQKKLTVLWLAILFYTGVHMLFYVITRYREPLMPLLVLLTAFSFDKYVFQHQRNLIFPKQFGTTSSKVL